MSVDEFRTATTKTLNDRSHDSNTFGLQHTQEMIVQKKKELAAEAGLDPSTTKCSVSTQWAKIGMTVTAAESGLSFSKKKILTKTASRYRLEHVICGYSYALTSHDSLVFWITVCLDA